MQRERLDTQNSSLSHWGLGKERETSRSTRSDSSDTILQCHRESANSLIPTVVATDVVIASEYNVSLYGPHTARPGK